MANFTGLGQVFGGFESFGEAGQLAVQAASMKANAGVLDVEALGIMEAGKQKAKQIEISGDKIIARQRAMYSKAGVKFSGSPALVWAESEKNLHQDIINTRLNYAAEANKVGFQALQMRIAAGRARTAMVAKIGQGILQVGTGFAMNRATTSVLDGGKMPANAWDIENRVSGGR
jgi:hypothetical protein